MLLIIRGVRFILDPHGPIEIRLARFSLAVNSDLKTLKTVKSGSICVHSAPGFPKNKKKHCFWKVPRLCPFVLLVKITRRKWQWSVGSETDKLTLWPWSWTFKFQHTIYVKCEYFMNLKNTNIVKYTTFCRGINGDGASKSKKNHSIYCRLNIKEVFCAQKRYDCPIYRMGGT